MLRQVGTHIISLLEIPRYSIKYKPENNKKKRESKSECKPDLFQNQFQFFYITKWNDFYDMPIMAHVIGRKNPYV